MSGFLSKFRKMLSGSGDRPEREPPPPPAYGARDYGRVTTGLSSPADPDTHAETTEPAAPHEEVQLEEAPWEEAPLEEAPLEAAPLEEAPLEEAPLEEAPLEEALSVEHETVADALPAADHEPAKAEEDIAFDEEWYLLKYQDVARAVRINPSFTGLGHYLVHGRNEGRQPLPPPDWDREAAREAAARAAEATKIDDL